MKGCRDLLAPEARSSYARQGWTTVPRFFSGQEVAQLASFTEEVCQLPEVAGKQMVYHEPSLLVAGAQLIQRIENFCPFHSGFDHLVRAGRVRLHSRSGL